MPKTKSVRVDLATYRKIISLGDKTEMTASEVVAVAVEALERKLFWEQVNGEFAALRENRAMWKHEMEERAAWNIV